MCKYHYNQDYSRKHRCSVLGCTAPYHSCGYCSNHKTKVRKYGRTDLVFKRRKDTTSYVDGDVAHVFLGNGHWAVIDAEDFPRVSQYVWHENKAGYPMNNLVGALHLFLVTPPEGMWLDHKDQKPLNARKSNLRPVSYRESGQNRGRNKNNTSGFKGVSRDPEHPEKWVARITHDYRTRYLGRFDSPADAAEAYRQAAIGLGFIYVPPSPYGDTPEA